MKSLLSLVAVTAMLVGSQAMAIDPAKLTQALASPDRSAEDKELDMNRKPVQVLTFLGLKEGMSALDLVAGGGWYTEVLSRAVGPNGKVYMQNSPASLSRGTTEQTVSARVNGRLTNVVRVNRDMNDLGLAPDSIDFAITNLNFHDLYNSNPANARAMLEAVKTVLKPGGVFAIIDHAGNVGADNASLHRVPKSLVVVAAREAGFTIVDAGSAILSVPSDDHTLPQSAPELNRNTDRFIVKLTK
ncbi:MAG: class I SAM-dependent methyltransferase [Pseudomonadales bacterium]|nr:class I SAM-dependent methyltransferase [Pseudomonadales bacterium]MCP5345021.1 class I SAM-dependent methyltransferase [Pseudomonadales bacterium]MCP5357894.1 class I SAM-dependent methyltransferase [Pseudomonadales bacterium]